MLQNQIGHELVIFISALEATVRPRVQTNAWLHSGTVFRIAGAFKRSGFFSGNVPLPEKLGGFIGGPKI